MDNDEPTWEFKVLVNAEGQHSLWPEWKDVPAGWVQVGPVGDREHCMAWVDENWKDIRPKSVRETQ